MRCILVIVCILLTCAISSLNAQSILDNSPPSFLKPDKKELTFERVVYSDKPRDSYTVYTYWQDSTLRSVETYKYVQQATAQGYTRPAPVKWGTSKFFYPTGRLYLICEFNRDELNGPFTVYYPTGGIKRKELYRNGKRLKSNCFDSTGLDSPCLLFNRQPASTASSQQLSQHLQKGLMPLIDRYALVGIIKLTIDETGELIEVGYQLNRSDERISNSIKKVFLDMPRWHENNPNWKPSYTDDMPVTGYWTVRVYRDGRHLRISFPKSE